MNINKWISTTIRINAALFSVLHVLQNLFCIACHHHNPGVHKAIDTTYLSTEFKEITPLLLTLFTLVN